MLYFIIKFNSYIYRYSRFSPIVSAGTTGCYRASNTITVKSGVKEMHSRSRSPSKQNYMINRHIKKGYFFWCVSCT